MLTISFALFQEVKQRTSVSHLFYKSVVGTIQVEFSQVVPVSKDQVGLLFCTQIPDRKYGLQDWIGYEQPAECTTHTSMAYPMWTCRWWGHWGWVQSHPRRDSGSCHVCWCTAENRGRWLCTRLYPRTSSHPASAGNQDDTCTEGAKSAEEMSESHSLQVLALLPAESWPVTRACNHLSQTSYMCFSFHPKPNSYPLKSQHWNETQLLLSKRMHE